MTSKNRQPANKTGAKRLLPGLLQLKTGRTTIDAVATIGLDIAKLVFQVPGVKSKGEFVLRRQLERIWMLPFFAKLLPCLPRAWTGLTRRRSRPATTRMTGRAS